jgi:ABC-2 type transport system permease protein
MTSTIYDLGYQRYDGPRHGRGHAVRALFLYSLRAAFGVGRGEQARRLPLIVGALAFAPALVQIGVASQTGMLQFISYANYLEFVAVVLALFLAGQAPELLVTDKQSGALTLYLARPITAADYAWAKLAALTAAMTIMTMVPQLMLYGAKIFLAQSPWAGFKEHWAEIFPILGGSLLIALFFAAVGLALSSFAMKRAYGSASVIAFFLLMPALTTVVRLVVTGDLRRWAVLLNPVWLVSGYSRWLFEIEASRRSVVGRSELPGQAYMWALLLASAVGAGILLYRYRRSVT